jgi:hypothetical protein
MCFFKKIYLHSNFIDNYNLIGEHGKMNSLGLAITVNFPNHGTKKIMNHRKNEIPLFIETELIQEKMRLYDIID